MSLKPGEHVIEVGCGNGTFLPRLAEAVGSAGRVVGLDHSDELVSEARGKVQGLGLVPPVEVTVGDAYRLPFEPGSFHAAHCERVLMHLEDPTAALREMARVVRTGGCVVAAEPDWAGIRIDHPDREAFDLVYLRALKQRQKDVGLTLRRRMSAVGLRPTVIGTVPFVFDQYSTLGLYGLDLVPIVDLLVAEGAMPAERLREVIPALEDSDRVGGYYAAGFMHVVGGRRA
jgi:SAM-dependent methyltransferase